MNQEEIVLNGHWWIPNDIEKKFGGSLTVNRKEFLHLEIFGTFLQWQNAIPAKNDPKINIIGNGDFFPSYFEIIHGETTKGEILTLIFNNVISTSSPNFPSSSGTTEIRSTYCLKGHHFDYFKDVQFSLMKAEFQNFKEWLYVEPFEGGIEDKEKDKIVHLKLNPTWKHEYDISLLSFKCLFDFVNNCKLSKGEYSFIGNPCVSIIPSEDKDLDWFLERLFDFQNLITLLMGFPTRFLNISAKFVQTKEMNNDSIPIEIYYINEDLHIQKIDNYKMLVPYSLLNKMQVAILNTWFEKLEYLRPYINTFTASFYNSKSYLETRFLNCTYVCEAIYKKENKIKKISLEKILKRIFSEVPEELKKLFIKSENDFIKIVLQKRNQLVHGNDLKNELEGKELYLLAYRLQFFTHIYILNLIGIDYESINSRIRQFGLMDHLWDR